MKKIEEIVASLIDAADTCEEVEEYFKNGNTPKGPYIDLAKYFLDDNYLKRSKGDEAYKKWLREPVSYTHLIGKMFRFRKRILV